MSETRHFHILLLDNDLENDQKYFVKEKEEEQEEQEEQEKEEQQEQVIPLETLWNRHQVSCRGQIRFRGLNVIICKSIWYNIEKSKNKTFQY